MPIRIDPLRNGRLRVFTDGRFVAGYTLGRARPYVYPLLTPSGRPVTEEQPVDHPHHQSLWLAQAEVNGSNFFGNRPGDGRITGPLPDVTVQETRAGPAAVFRQALSWHAADGTVVLEERRVTALTPTPDGTLIDVRSERRPAAGPVTFGQTKEGGFGIRVSDVIDEEDGGTLVNDRGGQGEAGTFDREADWIDYWGQVAGQAAGLALFPHPGNPRHPWFTRAYGIVLCNHHRFGPQTLAPGQTLRLQWRVVAHDGSTAAAGIAQLYADYLRACREELAELLAGTPS